MDEISEICCMMISKVGEAKSKFVEAMREARRNNFTNADKLMVDGNNLLLEGERYHAKLLQKSASESKLELNLLIVHVEDQMSSSSTIEVIAEEFIELCRERK